MDKQNYKPRVIDAKMKEYLSAFGAVCIEGPKVVRKDLDIFLSQQKRDLHR